MWLADNWTDYEVIDCSKGEKLERWGDYLLIRPDPQIIWDTPKTHRGWKKCSGHYHRSSRGGGEWGIAGDGDGVGGARECGGACGVYQTDGRAVAGGGGEAAGVLRQKKDAGSFVPAPHTNHTIKDYIASMSWRIFSARDMPSFLHSASSFSTCSFLMYAWIFMVTGAGFSFVV